MLSRVLNKCAVKRVQLLLSANASSLATETSQSPPLTSFANRYEEHFFKAASPAHLEDFWREQAKGIDWFKEPETILDQSNPPFFRWFKGGQLNTSYNCLDRHVQSGLAEQPALIFESPVSNTTKVYSYGELTDLVSRFANVLQKHGVQKGDRVIVYMPMIPEAIIAQHACNRIGAVHSVVFGGFAGPELASRIKDCGAKLIVTASCGIEPNRIIDYKPMIDEAVQIVGKPDMPRIVVQRDVQRMLFTKKCELDFYDELARAKATAPVPVDATDYLYVLYTSGTTGTPKGVVRDNGGNAVALSYAMKHQLNINRGDIYFSAADIGWAVGHSYGTYAPLLVGATSVLFEGKPVGTPDAGIIWRICEKYGVKGLYTAPTAVRALRREDPEGAHIKKADLSKLNTVCFAGERMDVPAFQWLQSCLPKDTLCIDNYWQTETGWSITANYRNLHTFNVKPGSAGKPAPGQNLMILDKDCAERPSGKIGAICLKFPTAPNFASTLYNNDEGFVKKYLSEYPGYYFTGDVGYKDADGNLHIVSRVDDVINTAGHRLSTSQMEEILTHHPDIVEAAVIAAKDEMKGEIPVGFVVLKDGLKRDAKEVEKECIQKMRKELGAVASFKYCLVVDRLPKTRSGKIVRKVLRNVTNGERPEIPPTIEDARVVDVIKVQVEERGFGKHVTLDFADDAEAEAEAEQSRTQ